MNVIEREKLFEILKEFSTKVECVLDLWGGLVSLKLKDDSLVKEFSARLNEVPSVREIWNKNICVFDNYRIIHENDTVINILLNLCSLGIESTHRKIENLIDNNSCVYYHINTLKSISFDKKYRVFGCIDLVNIDEIPLTAIEQWHNAMSLEYGYSKRGVLHRINSAFVFKGTSSINSDEIPNDYYGGIGTVSYMITKKMNVLSWIIPLITQKPCTQVHHYCELDSSDILGIDQGSSEVLYEINSISVNTVTLDIQLLEELTQRYLNLDNKQQEHIGNVLRRFNVACSRHNQLETLIELRIIIESILAGDRGNEPISHVISQRGAWLLGDSVECRIRISKFLKKAYGLSSSAVHGSYSENTKNYEIIEQFKTLCHNLIIKAIYCEIPLNTSQWTELVMGK